MLTQMYAARLGALDRVVQSLSPRIRSAGFRSTTAQDFYCRSSTDLDARGNSRHQRHDPPRSLRIMYALLEQR